MPCLSPRVAGLVALACALFALAAPAGAGAVDRYVALGDSFSSGVGTGSYTLSSSCRRSVYAYPYLVSQQRPNTALDFVACSGATTSDVMANQIQAVTATTSIVSVTIGGNDIRFADLIVQCTLSNCSSALDSTRTTLPTVLEPRLDAVYTAISNQAAFGASVVVLGYPRIFTDRRVASARSGSARRNGRRRTSSPTRSTASSRRAPPRSVSRTGARSAPFSTHAVCASSPWVNGLSLFNLTESYHPNRNGNSLGYAPLVRSVIG